MRTIKIDSSEDFTIVVETFDEMKFDVYLLRRNPPDGHLQYRTNLESYSSEKTALKCKDNFIEFYTIAIAEGFKVAGDNFVKDGKEVWVSYAMDTDRTKETFLELLRS